MYIGKVTVHANVPVDTQCYRIDCKDGNNELYINLAPDSNGKWYVGIQVNKTIKMMPYTDFCQQLEKMLNAPSD